jgi:hypothetical protein
MTILNSLNNKTVKVHPCNFKNEVKPLNSHTVLGSNIQFNRMFSSLSTGSAAELRKQQNIKNFKLDPNYITGFTDGEGYFSINLARSVKVSHG